MLKENYCRFCGFRILPNEPVCNNCGGKTKYKPNEDNYVFTPPIYCIGFFDLGIDFSPYIESGDDFKYDVCSCGYLNEIDDEFCYMCGAKKSKGKIFKLIKNNKKSSFLDNILCECGNINSKDSIYCEFCGIKLKKSSSKSFNNYNNFDFDFENPIFCFCGEENDSNAQWCRNCGRPLVNQGEINNLSVLCTCSQINDISSEYCIECGINLKNQDSKIICVCGHLNSSSLKFCEYCERPLNPQRTIETKLMCACGEIIDFNSEFCPNCGSNIRRIKLLSSSVKNIKNIFR